MDESLKQLLPPRSYDLIERANIATYDQLLLLSSNDIKCRTYLNSADINYIKDVVAQCVFPNKLGSWDISDKITTGCQSIDSVLRGGFLCKHITEIYGNSSTGKTQICLQATAHSANRGVVYICTENQFPTVRLNQMLSGEENTHDVLDKRNNIFVKQITEVEDLKICLRVKLPNFLKNSVKISLLIIDSITAPFRGNYTNYIQRAKDLKEIAAYLMDIANTYSLAVICVNQICDQMIHNFMTGISGRLAFPETKLIRRYKVV